jgi:hypothetical protein
VGERSEVVNRIGWFGGRLPKRVQSAFMDARKFGNRPLLGLSPEVKVVCFDGVSQVFILKLVKKSSLEKDDGTLVRSFLVLRRRIRVSRGIEDWTKIKNAP